MRSWNVLELNKPDPVRRPASYFPEWAQIYECDNCGADLTKYLHLRSGHSWPPYGRERYRCRCGRVYMTGAVEWESLSRKEQRRRLRFIFGSSLFVMMFLSLLGVCLGLLFYWAFRSPGLSVSVGLVIALPISMWLLISELGGILHSIMRTGSAR